MRKSINVFLVGAVLVALSANALPTVEERLTSLSLEVKALQKDNDLLTASLKDNWVAFSSQCGKILAGDECQDIAKVAENEVECIDSKKKEWMNKPHHGEGRKLKGGKHQHDGKHHRGGKHGREPEMPSFTKATYCVLKQAYMMDAKVPVSEHCKRAAQRFELYQSVHRKQHPGPHDPPPFHFLGLLLFGVIISTCTCCIGRCVQKRCKSTRNARTVQSQASTNGVVYMGQPVVVTAHAAGQTLQKA